MDIFVNLSIFILILLVPLLLFSLFTKKVPKLKIRDASPYLYEIERIRDCANVSAVDGKDMENIKRSISHSIGILTCTVLINILAVSGLTGIVRTEEIPAAGIAVYLAVLGLFSAICLYKGITDRTVFHDTDDFNKRKGVLLRSKAVYYRHRKPITYEVLIGTYDDDRKPVVFAEKIPDFIFWAIEKNDKWSVVMYKGRPAAIIKG